MLSRKELALILSGPSGCLSQAPGAWLRVAGPDAAEFLQGQCTQDLRHLPPGGAAWALWLGVKGKVLGESLILREADGADGVWWLWSAHTAGEVLRTRLEDFIIADDVTVEDLGATGAWSQVTFAGEAGEAWLRTALGGVEPPAEGAWAALGGGYVFAGRRGQARTWEWLCPAEAATQAAGLPAIRPEDLVRARIAAGTPAISGEFGPNDLPQEAGLEAVAVSFNKGCYLGQEVMARLHAMGQVRRRLLRVAGEGAAPAAGAGLWHPTEARRAGELRAAVDDGCGGWLGLAMINLLGLDAGGPLFLSPGAGEVGRSGEVVILDRLAR